MLIEQLTADIGRHVDRLKQARAEIGDGVRWYRYDILANLIHIDAMLSAPNRDLGKLAAGRPVADIGAADGDLAFTVEEAWGWEVDIVDTASTNANGLEAARVLRDHLGSRAQVHDINLDQQFRMPRDHYGLVFLLGILYHLQNPFYVLHELASRADHCLLSTKVARFAGPERTPIAELPVGYLLGPLEANNDPTNYWVFSSAGLARLVDRAGWDVLDTYNAGNTTSSDPATPEGDEREFMLLRSRLTGASS